MASILTTGGRTVLAEAISVLPIFLAIGQGDPAWDAAPVSPSPDATALSNEIGRRIVDRTRFVVDDPAGEIVLSHGRYTVSETPTHQLLLEVKFGFGDAANLTIREVGVFIGTEPVTGLPAGQRYFAPSEIADPGDLFSLDRLAAPLQKTAAFEIDFSHVLTL